MLPAAGSAANMSTTLGLPYGPGPVSDGYGCDYHCDVVTLRAFAESRNAPSCPTAFPDVRNNSSPA